MRSKEDDQGLGALLLAFYECLTDPDQLDTLMEMLTSWLDDDERHVVTPKLDTHVEQALKLLGDLSTNKLPATQQNGLLDQDTYDSGPDLEAALRDKLAAEDVFQLHKWITSGTADSALLLRAFEAEATDLIILTFDPELNRYVAKRAGAKYNETIASFMAESFDLTRAELALLGELLGGGTLRDVADRLGKSWETTRSQVKTLTNKMGVSSQADILRMATQAATLMPYPNRSDDVLQMNTLRSIGRPNGRRMCYEIDTPRGWQPGGPTLVYLHGMVEGRHWPERARDYAAARGWRVVRISRAGRGASSLNPKQGEALLKDHIQDVMAIVDHEKIETFCIFGAADGFAVGYPLALQHPERVRKIIGLEIIPPILHNTDLSGLRSKMKTFGLASLYAPRTIRFMMGIAMHKLNRMKDRYSKPHPLLGVQLDQIEDADGLRVHEANFQDLMKYNADALWRDSSFASVDWAFAHAHSNARPQAAIIHCGNSMVDVTGFLANFAQRIGAQIYSLDSYLPHLTSCVPLILQVLEEE